MNNTPPRPQGARDNKETPMDIRSEIILQIILFSIGFIVSFPIIIAIFTSFKVPEDITNYPPTLLPRQNVRVDVDGFEEPLRVYDVDIDGEILRLAETERADGLVFLVDPDNPDTVYEVTRSELIPITRIAFTFENYETAWTSQPFARYFLNSIIQTGIIVAFQLLFSILAAYAFSILQFPGRDLMFYLILGSLMVPFQLTFIPNFILVSELGLANTYAGLTIPFLASAFGVFLLRQFFLSLPPELHDAARIDGASNWLYLWQIVVPLSKGAISAFGIFAFLGAWSQYLWPLVITNEQSMRTIQIGIRFFLFDQERGADWGGIMATAVIALLPTLIIFLIAQRQLVRGIAMTGLKG
ncbi:MAG: carbohydrate ABC transporter permease [Chloroflexota bacterium]